MLRHVQGDYAQTLEEFKRTIDLAFAGGVTQVKVHGYPYANAPGAVWPGWSPMSSQYPTIDTYYNTLAFSNVLTLIGFGEQWGDRQPMWRHWPAMSDYVARTSQILQRGRPRVDVAIYRQEYALSSEEPGFPAKSLGETGFTYEYVDAHSLTADALAVEDGRLGASLAGYRAVVLDERALAPDVAARLAELAEDGLAVVIVGRQPDRAPGFRGPESNDRRVQESIARLLLAPRVRQVEEPDDVRAALERLGVEPDVVYTGGAPLTAVHRQTEGADYWYLLNQSDERVRVMASFSAKGPPRELDAWRGTISELALYRRREGRVELPMTLEPHGTRLIAFSRRTGEPKVHVISTTADDAAYRGRAIEIRDYQGGEREIVLSNGTSKRLSLPAVPESVELRRWRLLVDDWRPSGPFRHDLELDELRDWREISELRDTSGVGTYSTVFELPPEWRSRGLGVELDLGVVEGSVRVVVNGEIAAPQSVADRPIAIGHLLRDGANHVTIELATTLRNRLHALGRGGDPNYARFLSKEPATQPYGLLGPVRLVPYAERVVEER
ncbi:MAG: glycosyl hydrolase [Solirubrobacteraceae bacterium]